MNQAILRIFEKKNFFSKIFRDFFFRSDFSNFYSGARYSVIGTVGIGRSRRTFQAKKIFSEKLVHICPSQPRQNRFFQPSQPRQPKKSRRFTPEQGIGYNFRSIKKVVRLKKWCTFLPSQPRQNRIFQPSQPRQHWVKKCPTVKKYQQVLYASTIYLL